MYTFIKATARVGLLKQIRGLHFICQQSSFSQRARKKKHGTSGCRQGVTSLRSQNYIPRGLLSTPDFNSMMSKADKLFISLLVWMPAISNKLNPLLRVFSGVRCVIEITSYCLVSFSFFLCFSSFLERERGRLSPPSAAELHSQGPHFGNEQKPGLETGEEPWASWVDLLCLYLCHCTHRHTHAQRERGGGVFSFCISWLGFPMRFLLCLRRSMP